MNTSSKSIETLLVNDQEVHFYSLPRYAELSGHEIAGLPFSIRILLEMLLRNTGEAGGLDGELESLAVWEPFAKNRGVIRFHPQRVLMQDLTGVPVLNDLASLRAAALRAGGDPERVNPLIPVDLVVDHSIQVDYTGMPDVLQKNMAMEFQRNRERYDFLRWAQSAFRNFRLIPPGNGIVHQVNLEVLSPVVWLREKVYGLLAVPDMVVGTDSHTPMINGLGVLGWGVGGIEAIAAMLGEGLELPIPDVVGVYLSGKLHPGVTPTDLTLTIVERLRSLGVVDKFIEFCGPALDGLGVPERAMIANMAPEYGATASYFPVDQLTLDYLRLTGRGEENIRLVEGYFRSQGLFRTPGMPEPQFSDQIEVDLGQIESSLAGPKNPQSRISLSAVKSDFHRWLQMPVSEGGFGTPQENFGIQVNINGENVILKNGSIVLAAITSCTNTSNPQVMITAGLLARNAVKRGLKLAPAVKASLSPGSRVVTDYLQEAGLLDPLEQLGFSLAGYGCMTCIGNSGQLDANIAGAIEKNQLITAAVLSGNRNFEGRVQPLVRANYLASPPLVIAYALAGSLDVDLTHEPLGRDTAGIAVTLADLWPDETEINFLIQKYVTRQAFLRNDILHAAPSRDWQELAGSRDLVFAWKDASTYLKVPPFVTLPDPDWTSEIPDTRALAVFGDTVTTDHISPAGAIQVNSPAGRYLLEKGVTPSEFNSYGSRRGNDEVMARGTFANIRLKNRLIPGVEGGKTLHFPDGKLMDIYDAAMRYREENTPLLILAGREYGSGSSRDWAAKGVLLLGVRAVIAESFERIHRSNLAGMGVLPLQFLQGDTVESLGLTGGEIFNLPAVAKLEPGGLAVVKVNAGNGETGQFRVRVRLDTWQELNTFLQGGILKNALQKMLKEPKSEEKERS